MARGLLFKFLAILLCAALLLTALASGAAIIGLAASGLYSISVQELHDQQMSSRLSSLAHWTVTRYLAQELGGCPQRYLDAEYNLYISYPFERFDYDKWFYVITDRDGNQVDYKTGNFLASQATVYEEVVFTEYPTVVDTKHYDPDTGKPSRKRPSPRNISLMAQPNPPCPRITTGAKVVPTRTAMGSGMNI